MSSTGRGTTREPKDHYDTPSYTIRSLLMNHDIQYPALEPCAGNMAIVDMLKTGEVYSVDIDTNSHAIAHADYLRWDVNQQYKTIITNPPFNIAIDIIKKALADVVDGGEVIMLLRLNFLGSQRRRSFWEDHPCKKIHVLSKRPCFINGKSDSIEYAWFIWERGYTGKTEIDVI